MRMIIPIESIGKCEYCLVLLTIENLGSDAVNAEWRCPNCQRVLTHLSFGYENSKGGKKFWIGINGEWVSQKPENNFELGNWDVIVRHLPML